MLEGWYGKIIGAILGYIVGRGLLGAIVGFVIGHQFDVMSRRNARGALGRGRPGSIGADGPEAAGRGSPAGKRRCPVVHLNCSPACAAKSATST